MAEVGKGFSRASENINNQFRHASWGRTRTPKNILSHHRAGINSDGDPLVLTVAAGPVYPSVTFDTQNQRYLHVVCTARDKNGAVTITGRMHAAAATPITLRKADGSAIDTLALAGDSIILEIAGIDQITFTLAGDDPNGVPANAGTLSLYAACSTF